jgi:hypothetical protein
MSPLQPPPTNLLDRYYGEEALALYTGRVRVTGGEAGHGRASGVVKSDDGALDVNLRPSSEVPAAAATRSNCSRRATPPASTAHCGCWRAGPAWNSPTSSWTPR